MAIQNKIVDGSYRSNFKAPAPSSSRRGSGGSFGGSSSSASTTRSSARRGSGGSFATSRSNAPRKTSAPKRSAVRQSTTASKPVAQVKRQTGTMARPTQPRITSTSTGQISRTAAPAAIAAPTPAAAPIEVPKAPPPPPSIEGFLASDDAYKTQNVAIDQALADYLAQMGQQQKQYEGQYGDQMRDLGLSRDQSLGDLTNDFAGRGILTSGLYDQADQDMRRDYSNREADMGRAKGDFMANLQTGHSNFQSEQNLVRQNARREALARRAAQYNL